MGRKRIPTKQKLLRGTFNVTDDADRVDQDFPCLSENTIVEAPVSLSDRAKASWYSITTPLIAVGALHELDLAMLEEGLRLQDELEELNTQLSVLMTKKRKVVADYARCNKLSAMRNRSLQTYIKIMSAYGVSPAARASISNLVQRPVEKSKEEKEANPVLAILEE